MLDRKINDIIKEEMEREALALKGSKSVSVALSSSFEENKNKLPWPVSTGFISPSASADRTTPCSKASCFKMMG